MHSAIVLWVYEETTLEEELLGSDSADAGRPVARGETTPELPVPRES